ncbi:MAG: cytochrome oxidase small assembly protein [Pseudomonadota bacterium]|nr:cytochrome oxidase small assembly protein [Pseudomonadota bacterium]
MAARNRNMGTALVLMSIALVFFAGVIAKYWLFSGA